MLIKKIIEDMWRFTVSNKDYEADNADTQVQMIANDVRDKIKYALHMHGAGSYRYHIMIEIEEFPEQE